MIEGANPIGDDISVAPKEHVESFNNLNKFSCERVSRFNDSWDITVTVPQEQSVTHGERLAAWIFDIDRKNKEIVATTSDFGKADMHTLEANHLRAAEHIADLVFTPFDSSSEIELELISHAKGMLSRCLRKDQWDWYTVFALLGKPPNSEISKGRQTLTELRAAAQEHDGSRVNILLNQIEEIGIGKRFAYFVRRVNKGEEYGVIDDQYLLDRLHSMDPTAFEHFIADCWNQTGHSSTVVADEDDLGIDIIATENHIHPRKYLIQVKRYSPDKSIGLSEVQRYGGLAQDEDADRVYLITTADFTHNAKEWAEDKQISLINGSRLADLIRNKGLETIVNQYIT